MEIAQLASACRFGVDLFGLGVAREHSAQSSLRTTVSRHKETSAGAPSEKEPRHVLEHSADAKSGALEK